MTCMCGDPECPSCGTAQGTYVARYNQGARVVIGKNPAGYEVTLEFTIKTYGQDGDMRTTTEPRPYTGPFVRFCVIGTTQDPAVGVAKTFSGQIQGRIRGELDRYQVLYVSRKWLDRILELWDQYHMNDMKAGTEAQLYIVDSADKRRNQWHGCLEEWSVHRFYCEVLKVCGLYVDQGYEYAGRDYLRVISDKDLDEILNLIEEGAEESRNKRGVK